MSANPLDDAAGVAARAPDGRAGSVPGRLSRLAEYLCAAALAADVLLVCASVICRYLLHAPLEWAEDAARLLMAVLVFFGAGTVLARGRHPGFEVFRNRLPGRWQSLATRLCAWMIAAVSVMLFASSVLLLLDARNVSTPLGLPQWLHVLPACLGSLYLSAIALANALRGGRARWLALLLATLLCAAVWAWNTLSGTVAGSGWQVPPWLLLAVGFAGGMLLGMPIAFVLGLAALLYFLAEPSLPLIVYSQQVLSGMDHFVLLAIPFFVLAGLLMEVNGMSARLVELLVLAFGRVRGAMNLIAIVATAVFSGVSGSKLADIAAVGGIVVPAVHRTRQDANETAAVLASSAVMAETIAPCINLILMGFVANISIGGLFLAGVVPAAVMTLGLIVLAVARGSRIDPALAFPVRKSRRKLAGGALATLLMIAMIGKGVTSGMATSTEVSAFAVVYALLVGVLVFRELDVRAVVRLFARAAAMTGSILFVIATASSLAFALSIQQLPGLLQHAMTGLAVQYGSTAFLLVSVLLTIVFGTILEGAPALILFGPLLAPIAGQAGVHPLHFGTVMVIAMGFGLFMPPLGLGLFATCAMTGTRMEQVAGPMLKYLALLLLILLLLVLMPSLTLWLPRLMKQA